MNISSKCRYSPIPHPHQFDGSSGEEVASQTDAANSMERTPDVQTKIPFKNFTARSNKQGGSMSTMVTPNPPNKATPNPDDEPYDFKAQQERNYRLMLQGLQERSRGCEEETSNASDGCESDNSEEESTRMESAHDMAEIQSQFNELENDSFWCLWPTYSRDKKGGLSAQLDKKKSGQRPAKKAPSIQAGDKEILPESNPLAENDRHRSHMKTKKLCNISEGSTTKNNSARVLSCSPKPNKTKTGTRRRNHEPENSEDITAHQEGRQGMKRKRSTEQRCGPDEESTPNDSNQNRISDTSASVPHISQKATAKTDAWQTCLLQLQKCKERTGTTDPTNSMCESDSDEGLVEWLKDQKHKFREGILDSQKAQQLFDLGCTGFDKNASRQTGAIGNGGGKAGSKPKKIGEGRENLSSINSKDKKSGERGINSAGACRPRSKRQRTAKKLFGIEQYDFF